uniref:Uncharacterized protein n=1 Tax=Arundo donax TaxID=35708 RepID=A0A0A9GN03_ARUDO
MVDNEDHIDVIHYSFEPSDGWLRTCITKHCSEKQDFCHCRKAQTCSHNIAPISLTCSCNS